jgi:hypothetical protein
MAGGLQSGQLLATHRQWRKASGMKQLMIMDARKQ